MTNVPALVAPWQNVFREGIAPQLVERDLAALLAGLMVDDPALIQSATVSPFPSPENEERPCCGACLIAYALWKGFPLPMTTGEVESAFAAVVAECDKLLGYPASARPLTNYWDESPREVARQALAREVRRELALRQPPRLRVRRA